MPLLAVSPSRSAPDLTASGTRHKFLVGARVMPGRPGLAVRPGRPGTPVAPGGEEPSMTEMPREVAYLVSFVLVEAAIIDGRSLRVPNWLTLHFALGGWLYAYWCGGGTLLLWSISGSIVGLLTLMPLYAIGG